MLSRTDQVRAHLLSGKTITQGEALLLGYGTRLSSSIHKLRERGYDIRTTMKEDIHGYPYAEYALVQRNRNGVARKAA